MNDKQTIGAKIKTLRQRKRWTQEKLVEVARQFVPEGHILNRPNISMYESAKTRPDSWAMIAIAKALGVTVEYLTGEERPAAMLTPEPELWDMVETLNRQRPEVRALAARLMVAALNYARGYAGELVNSAQPETSTGATYRQALADFAAQSVKPQVEQALQADLAQQMFDELGSADATSAPDVDAVEDEVEPQNRDR